MPTEADRIEAAIADARRRRSDTPKKGLARPPPYVPGSGGRHAPQRAQDTRVEAGSSSDEEDDEPAKKKGRTEAKDEEEEDEQVAEDYVRPNIEWPGTLIFVAKKFSGKTTLLVDLVHRNDFDNVFVITCTGQNDELRQLVHDERDILDDFSDEAVDRLLEAQEKYKEKVGTYPRTCLIFDDFIGLPFDVHKSKKMRKLATSGRHWNVSLVFSSQHLKSLPPALRQNPEYLCLGINTERAIQDLTEDLAMPSVGRPRFKRELTLIARRHNFEFMCIDERNQEYTIYKAPPPAGASRSMGAQGAAGK